MKREIRVYYVIPWPASGRFLSGEVESYMVAFGVLSRSVNCIYLQCRQNFPPELILLHYRGSRKQYFHELGATGPNIYMQCSFTSISVQHGKHGSEFRDASSKCISGLYEQGLRFKQRL